VLFSEGSHGILLAYQGIPARNAIPRAEERLSE
jgi:hypothetical protein